MLRKSGKERHRPAGFWRRCRTLRSLKQIHAHLITTNLLSHPSSIRELIFSSAMSVPFAFPYSLQLFDAIPYRDSFTFATMIRAASHSHTPHLSFPFYSLMLYSIPSPFIPHHLVFPFLLRAATHLQSPLPLAPQLHSKILKLGLEYDTFINNALINYHAKCGDLSVAARLFSGGAKNDIVARSSLIAGYARRGEVELARKVFDESPDKDLVSWNVMITGYAKRGEMERARELFDEVPEKDTVTWNVIVAGYVKAGAQEKAMEVFEEMRRVGEEPDEVTMMSLIAACADSTALDVGMRLHSLVKGVELNVNVANALIDMYAKCGCIGKSVEVFRGMREKNVSSWNSIIGGLALHGLSKESVCSFEEMRRERLTRPNEITFVSVLVACSHGGMVEEGRRYFNLMKSEYGIRPNVKHCGCMVDLFGRAGLLEEAFEFVDGMEVEANPIIWRTLLGACKVHGNVELGKRANEELLKMRWEEEAGSGDYVLLSNIYASVGEWRGVEKVRTLMTDNGVIKEAGSAVIEAGQL